MLLVRYQIFIFFFIKMKRGYNFLEITKNRSLRVKAGMLFPGVVFPKPSFPCTLNVNHSRRSPTIWNHENSHCLCSPSLGNADALTGLKKTACLHRVVHFLVLDCSTNNWHPRGAVLLSHPLPNKFLLVTVVGHGLHRAITTDTEESVYGCEK